MNPDALNAYLSKMQSGNTEGLKGLTPEELDALQNKLGGQTQKLAMPMSPLTSPPAPEAASPVVDAMTGAFAGKPPRGVTSSSPKGTTTWNFPADGGAPVNAGFAPNPNAVTFKPGDLLKMDGATNPGSSAFAIQPTLSGSKQDDADNNMLKAMRMQSAKAGVDPLFDVYYSNPTLFGQLKTQQQQERAGELKTIVSELNTAPALQTQENIAKSQAEQLRLNNEADNRNRIEVEKIRAGAHTNPAALRSAITPQLLAQAGNDPVKFRSLMKMYNDSMRFAQDPLQGPVPQGGLPMTGTMATPGVAPAVPAVPGAHRVPPGAAAQPGGPVLDEQSFITADNARKNAMPLIAKPGAGPDAPATSLPGLDVKGMEEFIRRLNSQKVYENPAAEKQIASELAAGKYGDPMTVKQMLARTAAANQFMMQRPPNEGGITPGTEQFPGQYIVPGVRGNNNVMTIDRGPVAGLAGGVGRIANKAWSFNSPYNRIRLADGTIVDFNPNDAGGLWGRTLGDTGYRSEQAPAVAATAISLLEHLMNPNRE